MCLCMKDLISKSNRNFRLPLPPAFRPAMPKKSNGKKKLKTCRVSSKAAKGKVKSVKNGSSNNGPPSKPVVSFCLKVPCHNQPKSWLADWYVLAGRTESIKLNFNTPKNRRTNACSCVAFILSKQIDLRCRQDALDWMPPVTSMASMHNQVNMPMLQGSLESVTPYLQLDISWRNPRWYPLSPPKKVHKIFDTKVSNCLGQTKLTKQNHSLL